MTEPREIEGDGQRVSVWEVVEVGGRTNLFYLVSSAASFFPLRCALYPFVAVVEVYPQVRT